MKEKTLKHKLTKVLIILFLLFDLAFILYGIIFKNSTIYFFVYYLPLLLVNLTMFVFIIYLNDFVSSRWFILPLSFVILKILPFFITRITFYEFLLLIAYIFILIDVIRYYKKFNLSKIIFTISVSIYLIVLFVNVYKNYDPNFIKEYILIFLGFSGFSNFCLIGYFPILIHLFFGYKKIELKSENNDVVRKLINLKELFDNGLITTEDFNLKKEELLKLFSK